MKTEKDYLELKHLVPYLPYGLKVRHNISPTIQELIGMHYEQFQEGIYCLQLKGKKMLTPMSAVKPILRPIADLTKTIVVNGETFVPINKLKGLFGWDYLWEDFHKDKQPFNIYALKYASVVKLFEWHLDVFGLIEKGLAIDINTL